MDAAPMTAPPPRRRRRGVRELPWWDILFVLLPAIGIVVCAVQLVSPSPWPWSSADALIGALLSAAVCAVWFAYGRRHQGPHARGYVSFLVIMALIVAAIALVPPLGLLQALLYPYLWNTLENTRLSIIGSIVIAALIGTLSIWLRGPEIVPTILFVQPLSVLMSIGIGLAITTAWEVADERRALLDELTRTQEQVRDLSRLAGVAHERERISRELHDTLAQTLAGLSLQAERSARSARRDGLDESTAGAFERLSELAKAALAETRALIAESAPVHDDSGMTFERAVARLVERFRRETDIAISLDLGGVEPGAGRDAEPCVEAGSGPGLASPHERLPRDLQVVLLRSLQEGLANVRRHSQATTATVRLDVRASGADAPGGSSEPAGVARVPRWIELTISDDGDGFAPEALDGSGFGLPGLRERARHLDGTVEVEASPGEGSTITIRLPLADEREPATRMEHGHD